MKTRSEWARERPAWRVADEILSNPDSTALEKEMAEGYQRLYNNYLEITRAAYSPTKVEFKDTDDFTTNLVKRLFDLFIARPIIKT